MHLLKDLIRKILQIVLVQRENSSLFRIFKFLTTHGSPRKKVKEKYKETEYHLRVIGRAADTDTDLLSSLGARSIARLRVSHFNRKRIVVFNKVQYKVVHQAEDTGQKGSKLKVIVDTC